MRINRQEKKLEKLAKFATHQIKKFHFKFNLKKVSIEKNL